ncbi:hypothetical protein COV93_08890 [Candidatus Woesearchaeota archaeon CG11_big_fil_rev_8_21_14_0_20_43_8]|nr:MAG: hypothetical protein COV93_08890 [Candidatus Woesearchaeota archaeon CG11_big_fil_rev_8_21_14_0_20_43_8]PIO06382.1 MAG: hypothetical protein COT47_03425 [Candidatus Woesearchaeota archaeon CG08_land_8_20_14_0_20_43_7]
MKWCLKKAEKEIEEKGTHRGLKKIDQDKDLASMHIRKSEHNLNAIKDFKRIGYSDWSASAAFYSIYHSLLAIITSKGYEGRNQECTFALIYQMIENKDIDLDIELIKSVHLLDHESIHEDPTIIELRESGQYGVSLTIEDSIYERLLLAAKVVLDKSREIIED